MAASVQRLQATGHGAARHRRARHHVDDVSVEARIEAEAVLAGQVGAPASAGAGDRLGARLAAPARTRLVDVDLEAALGELVRTVNPPTPPPMTITFCMQAPPKLVVNETLFTNKRVPAP